MTSDKRQALMFRICLLLSTLIQINLFAQTPERIQTTKQDFDECKAKEAPLAKSEQIKKVNKTISIKTKGKPADFVDDLSNDNYQTYTYFGDLIKDKLVVIKAQDYNTDRYITVNLETREQEVFIGLPHIYGENIACLQGAETDVSPVVELWNVTDNKLTKVKTFEFGEILNPIDLVWKDEIQIIIKDSKGTFWKTKIISK